MTPGVLEIEPSAPATAEASARLLEAGPATDSQQSAWETFQSLPLPARTDEAWRFSTIKALDLSRFTTAQSIDDATREDLLRRSEGLDRSAGRMVFGNDTLLTRDIYQETLQQKGVLWLPLEQALAEHDELVRSRFMREDAILGGRKFAALHASQVRTGTFLYVPRGVEIELPIEAFHWLHGSGGSCFPHTLIVAEPMSKVTVVDYFASADATAPGFACAVNDLWLGDGAQVSYVCSQAWSTQALSVQINSTVVGRDAAAKALTLNVGSRYARSESVSHLRGPGGRSDMLAVAIAEDSQEFDQRTFQVHEAPNTSSDLLYKNALDDQSRTIFSGLIRVAPGAHKTDAYQKVRNLLLSDDAEANSMPGLEIEADDVRCTHGATSGQIEAEELFYLRSRGIPLKEAQRLVVYGFLDEVIERLGNDAIAEKLCTRLHAKFDAKH
jgi:Fe-S cluster assembly protein SufD